jgi:hypothetical protein
MTDCGTKKKDCGTRHIPEVGPLGRLFRKFGPSANYAERRRDGVLSTS